jgi:hypothetical protein
MTLAASKSTGEMHEAIEILAAFVRNVHLQRVVLGVEPRPRLNFWNVIYGNFLDIAVIEWSKLFGYDRKQPTQWRTLVPEAEHADFQLDLVRAVGLSRQEWHDYQDEIKTYRDKRAAHHASSLDPDLPTNFPRFDVALKAARFYYDWILKRMQDRGETHHYPLDLDDYCRIFSEQAREVAQRAIAATATMDEKVM